jgi:hypothetical protein
VKGRLRGVFIVLGIFAALSLLAWVSYRPAPADYPPGSSLSTQPNGVKGLFLWTEVYGAKPQRLEERRSLAVEGADMLIYASPFFPVTSNDRARMDTVADRGGTVVLAGDSDFSPFEALLKEAGISIRPGELQAIGMTPGGGLNVPVDSRLSLEGADATALLTTPNGQVVALRKPFRKGTVVALASLLPLTNQGLRDPDSARFVFEEVLSRLPEHGSVLFDETAHELPGAAAGSNQLEAMVGFVLTTPAGRAAMYAALLIFVYLLLSGIRLGPPLRPVKAAASSRTMYEQVQALAGLYRRGRQLRAARQHFARYYRRVIARALAIDAVNAAPADELGLELERHGLSGHLAADLSIVIASIETAPSERSLTAAVTTAERTVDRLPRSFILKAPE